MSKDFDPVSDDAIVLMAGIGAGLTAMGVALGAAEVEESVADVRDQVINKAGDVVEVVTSAPKTVANFLGFGRKGGLF